MGNRCTCFDNFINNNDYNLSNKISQKLLENKSSNIDATNYLKDSIASSYNLKKQPIIRNNNNFNIIKSNTNDYIGQRSNINININNINKIINNYDNNNYNNKSKDSSFKYKKKIKDVNYKKILIVSFIRGYILRKKYKNHLKEDLIKQGKDLYEQYLKVTKNEKVSQILEKNKSPKISKYLSTNWDEFYLEDPTKEIKSKIKKSKKYPKGLIFKYKTKNFHSVNLMECLASAKYCYRGEVELYTNKKCGNGEIIYSNGAREKGTYYNNEFNGWNILVDEQGILYVGLFNKLGLNGKGLRYNKEINHIYKGDFLNGLRHGVGKDYRNNSKYEGDFRKDKKCGKGKIVFDSGDIYEGEFSDNKFNGYGHYIWFKNGHEYKGNYLNGKFHGEGFYKWAENEYYNGEYVNGIKEGEGEISYADGKKFFVNFTNGKPNGIGMFQDQDGNQCEVEFINGKINKKYKKK